MRPLGLFEVEQIKQVANRRAVYRHIRIACVGDRVGEVVTPAAGNDLRVVIIGSPRLEFR